MGYFAISDLVHDAVVVLEELYVLTCADVCYYRSDIAKQQVVDEDCHPDVECCEESLADCDHADVTDSQVAVRVDLVVLGVVVQQERRDVIIYVWSLANPSALGRGYSAKPVVSMIRCMNCTADVDASKPMERVIEKEDDFAHSHQVQREGFSPLPELFDWTEFDEPE
jgi:hypothetical protein